MTSKINTKIAVKGVEVAFTQTHQEDYISITDIAKYKNPNAPADIIKNWLRNRSTIEFLGLWEKLNNPEFKLVEFDRLKAQAGANYFVLSALKWIETTRAIGIISRAGKGGGTYAHKDIAFEFASWVSSEFKLYLITEFQRLKDNEQKNLGWSVRRELAKINYRIHTEAVKENLIPAEISTAQADLVYAEEADVLNMALFGMTASEWRKKNPQKSGNIRDQANITQLVCLSNLENLNALFINEGVVQSERLIKLNKIAIHQMKLLTEDIRVNRLGRK